MKSSKEYSHKKKKFPVKADRIIIKFRKTISFRIISKTTVNRKGKALTKMEHCHKYLPWKLLRLLKVIFSGVFQRFISTDKQVFNISNKVTSIVLIDAFMIIYRSSHRRLLKVSQKSQESTCTRASILRTLWCKKEDGNDDVGTWKSVHYACAKSRKILWKNSVARDGHEKVSCDVIMKTCNIWSKILVILAIYGIKILTIFTVENHTTFSEFIFKDWAFIKCFVCFFGLFTFFASKQGRVR